MLPSRNMVSASFLAATFPPFLATLIAAAALFRQRNWFSSVKGKGQRVNAMTIKKQDPIDDDIVTNSDENKRLPDDNPEPLEGVKMDQLDTEEEGKEKGGNVAAKNEADTMFLDGSNANTLRTK